MKKSPKVIINKLEKLLSRLEKIDDVLGEEFNLIDTEFYNLVMRLPEPLREKYIQKENDITDKSFGYFENVKEQVHRDFLEENPGRISTGRQNYLIHSSNKESLPKIFSIYYDIKSLDDS